MFECALPMRCGILPAPSTRVIAHTGSLDLDHFGAQVGEVLRGPGPSENPGQVEHLDMPQRGCDGVALYE